MFRILKKKLKHLFLRLRWPFRHRSKTTVVVKRFGKSDPRLISANEVVSTSNGSDVIRPILRVATFNAALFSMAPAVPRSEKSASFDFGTGDITKAEQAEVYIHLRSNSMDYPPKGILKQSSLRLNSMNGKENNLFEQHNSPKSKLRVSINLPDNEISLKKSGQLSLPEYERGSSSRIGVRSRGKAPMKSGVSFSVRNASGYGCNGESYTSRRTILEVLREVDADVLALQGVKAEEEKGMKPLSDLAAGLGMNYVFAESWAPEYGNAILSKWPIKSWKAHKIFDDSDFRFFNSILDHIARQITGNY